MRKTCKIMTSLGMDKERITYVREWAVERMADEQFMSEVRRYIHLVATDPRIQLDWDYLGITVDRASLDFNVLDVNDRNFKAAEVKSISLNKARATLVIQLGGGGND